MDSFPLEQLVERAGSRYAVVVAAAQRAKQIKDGSPPLVQVNSRNPITIALAEMAAGKVLIMPPEEPPEEPRVSREQQYFVGRAGLEEEGLPFRRSPARAAPVHVDDTDDLEDEEDEEDFEDEEDLDDDLI